MAEVTPGSGTSEWKGLKLLGVVAATVVAVGGALIESGVIQQGTTVYLIIGALIAVAGALAKYMGSRAQVKSAALFADAKAPSSDPS